MAAETDVPFRIVIVKGHPVPEFPDECEPHTPQPAGYLQWHDWARKMGRTHDQRQCAGCGLYAIWEPLGKQFGYSSREARGLGP